MHDRAGLRRKVFIGGALLLGLLAAEVLGSVVYWARFRNDPEREILLRSFLGLKTDWHCGRAALYRPHHYTVFALNPDVTNHYEAFFGKKPVFKINSHGFRGEEVPVDKPDGVYRIACLGGSTTFGLNVPQDDMIYPRLLEAGLNARFKGRPQFEVINAGCPGWTAAESLIDFIFRVMEFKPDMAILHQGINDTFAMGHPDEGGYDYGNFRRVISFAPPGPSARALARVSRLVRLLMAWGEPFATMDIHAMAQNPVPDRKAFMDRLMKASGRRFRHHVQTFIDVAKANGVTPVLLTAGHGEWHPSLHRLNDITRDLAASNGVLLVDYEKVADPSTFLSDRVHEGPEGEAAKGAFVLDVLLKEGIPFNPQRVERE